MRCSKPAWPSNRIAALALSCRRASLSALNQRPSSPSPGVAINVARALVSILETPSTWGPFM